MESSLIDTACRHLNRAWFRRDYAECHAVLDDVLSTAPDVRPGTLGLLAAALLPMTLEASLAGSASDDLDAFNRRRIDLLAKAAATDLDLMIGLKSEELATFESAPEWATAMYNYVMLRCQTIGVQRRNLWEAAALIQWNAGRLLAACRLGEAMLAGLLHGLQRTHIHLNWEAAGPSVLKAVMQDERTKLQDSFVAQIVELAQAGRLELPENFILFDADGRLLPTLIVEVLKVGVRHANSVALLYFLVHQGKMASADFLDRVADQSCFLQSDHQILIVAGDFMPSQICRTLHQREDGVDRPVRLTWWLNVNFPREQVGNPALIASRIPLFVRVLIAQDKASLFLNASAEASWFKPLFATWINGLAEALQCRPDQITYLTQNTNFCPEYQEFRSGRGSPARCRVVAFNSHLLIGSLRVAPNVARPSKKFLCFNQRSHLHRAALMLCLRRDGIAEESHLSFNQSIRGEFPLDGEILEPWMQTPAAVIDRLINETEALLPLRLDLRGNGGSSETDGNYIDQLNTALFADAAVYLVTETEMEGRAMCRFTEKTVKGLAGDIPFIVFGGAGTLASLRDLGFQTFSPLIDERYDTIQDPVARFHTAYSEIRRLAGMTLEALIALRQSLKPVLDHNRRRLSAIEPVLHDHLVKAIDAFANPVPVALIDASAFATPDSPIGKVKRA